MDPFLLGAKIVGRWQSGEHSIFSSSALSTDALTRNAGCPINVSPDRDDKPQGFQNTFKYDPEGIVCPVGAHIKKANPFRGSSIGRILR